jgi:hypothetical protein
LPALLPVLGGAGSLPPAVVDGGAVSFIATLVAAVVPPFAPAESVGLVPLLSFWVG